jgi:hypothetical protein
MKLLIIPCATKLLAGCLLLTVAACSPPPPPAPPVSGPVPDDFDAAAAMREVEAVVALGPRHSGTPGAEKAARHIADRAVVLGPDGSLMAAGPADEILDNREIVERAGLMHGHRVKHRQIASAEKHSHYTEEE